MKKIAPVLLVMICLGTAGCFPKSVGSGAEAVPDDSYVVEEYYAKVLDNIKDKMLECEQYRYSSRTHLDSGRRVANYVIFGGLGAVVFKADLLYQGDKSTAVNVYTNQNDAEWAVVIETVRRGAFNAPGCPAKD